MEGATRGAIKMSIKDIARRGFVTDGLEAFWHAGNYDGNQNYITNNPFPDSMVDLTGNGHELILSNFAGTPESGAIGNNTAEAPSLIVMDNTDDRADNSGSIEGTNFPQDEFTIAFNIIPTPSGGYLLNNYSAPEKICLSQIATHYMVLMINNKNFTWLNMSSYYDNPLLITIIVKTGVNNFVKMYFNDVLKENDTLTAHNISDDWRPIHQKLWFQKDNYNNLSVYDKCLSLEEITQNYNAGLLWTPAPSNLFGTPGVSKFQNNSLLTTKFQNNSLSVSKYTNSYLEVSDQ